MLTRRTTSRGYFGLLVSPRRFSNVGFVVPCSILYLCACRSPRLHEDVGNGILFVCGDETIANAPPVEAIRSPLVKEIMSATEVTSSAHNALTAPTHAVVTEMQAGLGDLQTNANGDVVASPRRSERVTLYTATQRRGMTFAVWREMAQELWESRELTWRLFLRDFSARFRQSFLGYIWALVPILMTTAMFTWLNRMNVLAIAKTSLPYPIFVLLGMTVWQLFATGLADTTQSLASAGSLITKINFPRETLVLSAFGQSVFEFGVRSLLVAVGLTLFRIVPAPTILLIPFALIPLCLFTVGLGFLFSLVNGVMRDIGQLITFLITFWMFLTPVVYPPVAGSARSLINVVNPVSPFVIAAQDLTTRGALSQPMNYAIGCLVSVIVFLVGWRVFHLTETRIAERV